MGMPASLQSLLIFRKAPLDYPSDGDAKATDSAAAPTSAFTPCLPSIAECNKDGQHGPSTFDRMNRDSTMKCLSGKTALVTGATCAAGRASALALAQAGAQVLVHYASGELAADGLVAEIRSLGAHAEKVAADLRMPDGPHRLARRVRVVIGARLDVLVASADIVKDASLEDTSPADFDELFALNVRAPYFLVQQLMPAMCTGSSIVMVSSVAAFSTHTSPGNLSAYAASKGAIDTLVTHFASTLGARGVRVNSIAPGMQPGDVGNAVVFLASDAARWMTGKTLRVDNESGHQDTTQYL